MAFSITVEALKGLVTKSWSSQTRLGQWLCLHTEDQVCQIALIVFGGEGGAC